jgi:hypothetical protein
MRTRIRWRVLGATLAAFALLAAACGDDGSGEDTQGETPTTAPPEVVETTEAAETTVARAETPIVVSSFNFGESEILAEIYAQALEAEGYVVERKLNLGNREIVKPALENGEIDFVPEYVGTVLTFLGGTPTADSAATHADLVAAYGELGIAVLKAGKEKYPRSPRSSVWARSAIWRPTTVSWCSGVPPSARSGRPACWVWRASTGWSSPSSRPWTPAAR